MFLSLFRHFDTNQFLFFYLEALQFCFGNRIGLRNDRNNINFGIEFFHTHQIQRFQTMPRWTNKI